MTIQRLWNTCKDLWSRPAIHIPARIIYYAAIIVVLYLMYAHGAFVVRPYTYGGL